MENTLENKKCFFYQYYGQPVLRYRNLPIEFVKKLSFRSAKFLIHSYLELTPLSSITDEHAVECMCIELGIEIDEFNGNPKNTVSHYRFSSECYSREADFLRSKSYAIPFNGLSVEEQIERGWTKLRENV